MENPELIEDIWQLGDVWWYVLIGFFLGMLFFDNDCTREHKD